MPLHSYRKAPPAQKGERETKKKSLYYGDNIRGRSRRRIGDITIADVLQGLYHDFHKLMTTSRIAALIIPSILVVAGVYIIYSQVWPTIFQLVEESAGYLDEDNTALVSDDYVDLTQAYSNPGAEYFAQLKNYAQEENLLYNDNFSQNYREDFSLSIPSLELGELKVSSNVDSSVEAIYDEVLTSGLAHFSGTNLPISDLDTQNIVIYGHSSPGNYYERTKDPAAAFSRLSKIRYGAEIKVKIDGKEFTYKFIKGKTVDANDLSILKGKRGQKYLTLFTCYPNGNRQKRYVATARLVE